ncbi:Carbon-nitrogen hydrolase, partial [Rhypophila sp. PSN 637]
MKIACLQFAPQVGDVDNNLNRADAILNKAKAADLEDLDLLVLPELAFSGYNFTSLQQIAPYLEPPGSGISSLWARTTALKYDCSVIVGYPEKVDVSVKWPASPEYYNSALVVNGDGDTIANYRKCFLYYTDETWALEGKDGFFRGEIPRVGDVAMGICMDLNPYKFEAEWDAFEFGFHALDCEANVVILTMAWTTEQDPRIFSRRPQDPDLETLVYWIQRLEPLIRADREGEVIVVFCNRCGSEDDVTYAGTSAVLGILQGEVYVYGVLGRGVKDLLVVDTDNLPPSKLTDAASMDAQRKTFDAEVAEYLELDEGIVEEYEEDPEPEPEPEPISHDEPQNPEIPATQELEEDDCAIISDEEDDDGGDYLSPLPSSALHPQLSPLFTGRMSSLRNQLRLVIPTAPAISDPTPIEIDSAIPDSAIDENDDIIIDSPGVTNPSSPVLPKLVIPASPWRFRKKLSPYPWQQGDGHGPQPQVFGGGKVCMTPVTPFD